MDIFLAGALPKSSKWGIAISVSFGQYMGPQVRHPRGLKCDEFCIWKTFVVHAAGGLLGHVSMLLPVVRFTLVQRHQQQLESLRCLEVLFNQLDRQIVMSILLI
jgi:hypothetical protein